MHIKNTNFLANQIFEIATPNQLQTASNIGSLFPAATATFWYNFIIP
jgi:cation transporter-like permease